MAKYRRGDVINGYILDEDFRMKDGANCEWTFATKGSERYFIKQFLAPRYPVDGAPGSPPNAIGGGESAQSGNVINAA
jgi:hypothetical protein